MTPRPVFIIGTGRSGTTILRRLLGEGPGYRTPGFETQIFTNPECTAGLAYYRGFLRLANERAREAWRETLDAWIAARFRFKGRVLPVNGYCLHMDEADFDGLRAALIASFNADATAASLEAAARDFTNRLFAHFGGPGAAPHWVEDHPLNGFVIPQIAAIHPEARFVHAIRDGRLVAASMLKRGWTRDPEAAMAAWRERLIAARAGGQALPPGQYCEIEQARFAADPQAGFAALLDFLGEPHQPIPGSFKPAKATRQPPAAEDLTPLLERMAPGVAAEFGWLD